MTKAAKTRFNSIQDQLKNSDRADRLLISLNRICGQKNQFYKPTKELAGKIHGLTENKSPKSILIVGDPTLLTIDERFKNAGAEITLTLVSDRVPEDRFDLAARRISKYCEAYNIKRIVRFEDLIEKENHMHFDLIIANPPYGQIGTNITKKIIDAVGFGEYINLLPANDYTRVPGLTKHVISIDALTRGIFSDAAVTPAIAKISKVKINDKLPLEIIIESKKAGAMEKYLKVNAKLGVPYKGYFQYNQDIADGKVNSNCLLSLGHRDFAHGHLPYTKTRDYFFNFGKLSLKDLLAQMTHTYGKQIIWGSDIYVFASEVERNNFRDFMYSSDGYRFYSCVFEKAQVDSTDARLYVFPKVDWTRPWTVQEILKDYGYTDSEIEEVMKNLKNYKGMNA